MQRDDEKPDNTTVSITDTFECLQVFTIVSIDYHDGDIKTQIVDIFKLFLN